MLTFLARSLLISAALLLLLLDVDGLCLLSCHTWPFRDASEINMSEVVHPEIIHDSHKSLPCGARDSFRGEKVWGKLVLGWPVQFEIVTLLLLLFSK